LKSAGPTAAEAKPAGYQHTPDSNEASRRTPLIFCNHSASPPPSRVNRRAADGRTTDMNGLDIDVPVSPYIGTIDGQDDVVLSLLGVVPTEKIRFKKRDGDEFKYTKAQLNSGEVSLETLINTGVKSAATVSVEVKAEIKCYQVGLTYEARVDNGLAGTIIKSATYAIGFRLNVLAFNIKNETDVKSASLLAASASLNLASTLYQVSVLGAGMKALPLLKPILVASTADFNVQTVEAIGAAEAALEKYVRDNKASLTPSIESVRINAKELTDLLFSPVGTGDYLRDTLAQTYALERAANGASLTQALDDRRARENNLDDRIITNVYGQMLGLSPREKPTADAVRNAKLVLLTGRY
jgi:hypothetical protein